MFSGFEDAFYAGSGLNNPRSGRFATEHSLSTWDAQFSEAFLAHSWKPVFTAVRKTRPLGAFPVRSESGSFAAIVTSC